MPDNLIHCRLVFWCILGNNILDKLEHFKLLYHAKCKYVGNSISKTITDISRIAGKERKIMNNKV